MLGYLRTRPKVYILIITRLKGDIMRIKRNGCYKNVSTQKFQNVFKGRGYVLAESEMPKVKEKEVKVDIDAERKAAFEKGRESALKQTTKGKVK